MAGALQIVNTFKQGLTGSGTPDNFASGTGDITTAGDGSLIVPSFPDEALCVAEEIWAVDDTESLLCSFSGPDWHDREQGYEAWAPFNIDGASNSKAQNVSPGSISQRLRPGNQFFVKGSEPGGGGGNANIVFLLRYANLPGIQARLTTAAAVAGSLGKIVGVAVDVDASSGSGQGDWSADVALTATEGRRLDGSRYYAVVGFTSSVPYAAVSLRGFETGQLRIGAPAVGDAEHDAYSLLDAAMRHQDALLPVFRGYSQDNLNVSVADPKVTTGTVVVQLVEVPQSVYDAANPGGV